MSELADVTTLVFDAALYPRSVVSEPHVHDMIRAMRRGEHLPAIVADSATRRIADGVHRWRAHIELGLDKIPVEWRAYDSDAAFFRESVLLNTAHGMNLTGVDRLKVLEVGQQFGLKELDFAQLLRTSQGHVKALMPRYANVKAGDGEALKRVPLKTPTRHLAGQTITTEQADAIAGNAPGVSYLLVVRQLLSALRYDLLPPREQHPLLWDELAVLRQQLADTA